MPNAKDDKKHELKITNEKPVSVYPLTADEAMRALLQIKPSEMDEKKKPESKHKAKK